jgi:hypothetical protein
MSPDPDQADIDLIVDQFDRADDRDYRARTILAALGSRLLPRGGEERQIWRTRRLLGEGAAICYSREYAERFMDAGHVLVTATLTRFPDGSELVGPWLNVEEGTP